MTYDIIFCFNKEGNKIINDIMKLKHAVRRIYCQATYVFKAKGREKGKAYSRNVFTYM